MSRVAVGGDLAGVEACIVAGGAREDGGESGRRPGTELYARSADTA
ncbi:MAG: hypothetical protein ABEH77_09235 [Halobacteriaceae archaeon]